MKSFLVHYPLPPYLRMKQVLAKHGSWKEIETEGSDEMRIDIGNKAHGIHDSHMA